MARLNIERKNELEPKRMDYAEAKLAALGYDVIQIGSTELRFEHNGQTVKFFRILAGILANPLRMGEDYQGC